MLAIEARVRDALTALGPYLPADRLQDALELNAAAEAGVALENVCQQLYDDEVAIPQALLAELRALIEIIGLEPRYWQRLAAQEDASPPTTE